MILLIYLLFFFASVTACAVFYDRAALLHRIEKIDENLLARFEEALQKNRLDGFIQECEQKKNLLGQLILAGLYASSYGKAAVEEALDLAGKRALYETEQKTPILALIARLSPLLGLLGTVTGFYTALTQILSSGVVDLSNAVFHSSFSFALLSTAIGLVIAIASTLAYSFLVTKTQAFALKLTYLSNRAQRLIEKNLDAIAVSI